MIKIILLFVLMLSSCSSIQRGLPLYSYGFNQIKESLFSLDSIIIDEDYLKKTEYAFVRVRFGNSRSVIAVLVREKQNILEWISQDDIKIFTYNGKIIQTEGLPHDIEYFNFSSFNNIVPRSKSDSYIVSYYEPPLLEQTVIVDFTNMGQKEISNPIKGRKSIKTSLFIEEIFLPSINWQRKNKYYFNEDGQIEKTLQYIHPFLSPIEIEFIKKYRSS
jgi:hypothetical protein